jgi:GNAT superfamily N-acetyltransferase
MDIKPISESDLRELASLQKELIDEECNLDRMQGLFPTIQKDGNYYLLGVRSEGRLVASLAGIVCHDLFGKCIPYMIVENVIVAKDMRQQGIGTRLMKEIERIAMKRGKVDANKFSSVLWVSFYYSHVIVPFPATWELT